MAAGKSLTPRHRKVDDASDAMSASLLLAIAASKMDKIEAAKKKTALIGAVNLFTTAFPVQLAVMSESYPIRRQPSRKTQTTLIFRHYRASTAFFDHFLNNASAAEPIPFLTSIIALARSISCSITRTYSLRSSMFHFERSFGAPGNPPRGSRSSRSNSTSCDPPFGFDHKPVIPI